MGNGRWDAGDWAGYAKAHVSGKSAAAVFTSRGMKDAYDPAKIGFRESRDSADNPLSTPIILASDVTGSMGMVAHNLMRDGLNTIATEIYDRKPITDPHIMVMAVGDAYMDSAPIQMTQFEADIRLADQVRELYVEGGGGGNGGETYTMAWLAAALKVRADAFEKRKRKGYLFTIGDEPMVDIIRKDQITRFLGVEASGDVPASEALRMASRDWEVFHIVLANEGHCRYQLDEVLRNWRAVLPERTIRLEDVSKLAETVVSLVQVNEGANAASVASSWDGSTGLVVRNALADLTAGGRAAAGVRRLR